MFIEKIYIRNFRSIKEQEIECSAFVVFVGKNDAGKSNVLKALNLFFNNETDIGVPFDFISDFAMDHKTGEKKAKEVEIKITFSPPKSYMGHDKKVVWTKKWREYGFHPAGEKLRTIDNKGLPGNSKLETWVRKLNYQYVPAIKDEHHFSKLLTSLYETLYTNINQDLSKAGSTFIEEIRNHTSELSMELLEKLSFNSKIQLPSDLSRLFSTFDFETDVAKDKIPLRLRGDGIKSRHIPIVLKFISEKNNMHYTKGSVRQNTIWGYEEPENGLELAQAFILANDFKEYSKNVQLLVSTHSPVFYSLAKSESAIINYFVKKDAGEINSEFNKVNSTVYMDINRDLGMMTFLEPFVKEYQTQLNKIKILLSEQKNDVRPVLFVEGESDKLIIETAWGKINGRKNIPFKVQVAFDSFFICNTFRRGDLFLNNLDKIFIGLLDFDTAYTEWEKFKELIDGNGTTKVRRFIDFEKVESNGLSLKHRIHNGFICLLPIPDYRSQYAGIQFRGSSAHTIETMFDDDLIKEYCVDKATPGGGKILKMKDSKKRDFAKLTTGFKKKDFQSFKALFTLISKIISSVKK